MERRGGSLNKEVEWRPWFGGTQEWGSLNIEVEWRQWFSGTQWGSLNPPAPKVLGRDRPDGTRKRLQVYRGGAFFGQNLLFLIGRDARLQKTL